MITVTPSAADQIRLAASVADAHGMALRIAARRDAQGELEYAMGFDDARDEDVRLNAAGIDVVIARGARELVAGMTLDYVEYEAGDFRFIFINPNDAPVPAAGGCGTQGCGCGGA